MNSSLPRSGAAFIHRGAWGDLYVALAALKEASSEFNSSPLFVVGSNKWLEILIPSAWPNLREIWVSEDGKQSDVYVWNQALDHWVVRDRGVSLIHLMRKVEATFNIRTESLRFAWAPLLARVPRRHGSAEWPLDHLFYTHRAPWLGKDPILHERDRMLQIVEAPSRIGELKNNWKSGLPPIKSPDQSNAENLAHAAFGKYWLINPTSSRREKAWPAENFRNLFTLLHSKLEASGIALRLIGAPSEGDWLKEVLPPGLKSEEYLVQPARIRDLADVLGGSRLLVTNTSSVQFLAPGAGVPTITLMGRGDRRIWGPLGPSDVVIQGTVDSSLAGDIFAQERAAYASISVETVMNECLRHLREVEKQ